MNVKILGPLEVGSDRHRISPTAPKLRAVLALLSANVNAFVSTQVLIEELWGAPPPRSARTTLQGYIVGLRKLLKPAGAAGRPHEIIATVPGGYQLNNSGGHVDVWRFEELIERGHRGRLQGDVAGAAQCFSAALDCWRGSALADVQHGQHLSLLARRLEEHRLNALDCRIEADLRLGRHHVLMGELADLVARHPTHENFHAHYMLALYRSGRRCDALGLYRQLQDSLAADHGLDPTPSLRRLQRSMLSADPGISGAGLSGTAADEHERATAETRRPPGASAPRAAPRRGIPAELAALPWNTADSR